MLHSIPLKNVLKWLTKPKGPNLVEDPMGSAPEKALVLAVTKCMLYMEDPLSVGVGLVYKISLCFHGVLLPCLHAPECMACCGI